jgi:hypothetical protein
MTAFVVELVRFIATLWSRAWRWVFRSRRNFVIVSGVLGAAALAYLVIAPSGEAPAPKPSPTATAAPDTIYTEVEATADDQTPEQPTPTVTAPTAKQTTVPVEQGAPVAEPTEPAVNRQDPASVVKGWATAYHTRPSAAWLGWEPWVKKYATATTVNQLREQSVGDTFPLAGMTDTTVTKITVNPTPADGTSSTLVRWSHTIDVTVNDATGAAIHITYGVVAALGDDGWTITSVDELAVK